MAQSGSKINLSSNRSKIYYYSILAAATAFRKTKLEIYGR